MPTLTSRPLHNTDQRLEIKVFDRIAGMHMPPIEHALMAA